MTDAGSITFAAERLSICMKFKKRMESHQVFTTDNAYAIATRETVRTVEENAPYRQRPRNTIPGGASPFVVWEPRVIPRLRRRLPSRHPV